MNKLIYTSYSPNTRRKDWTRSVNLLFTPWKWKEGDANQEIVSFFKNSYPNSEVLAYNYARSAMYSFFNALNLSPGTEVIYQSCTCAAASLPAIWAGLKPIYVDINRDDLSPSVQGIADKVTENTKVIVVQYTMGFSPDIEGLRKLADENDLILVEDCTHFIPSSQDSAIGSYGDYAIFSFGRDKVVSGVDGGILISKNNEISNSLRKEQDNMTYPPTSWILQRILFAPMWVKIRATYNIKFGKLIHAIATKLGLLTRATSPQEKEGHRPDYIPALLPNALAELALLQLNDIDQLQEHRSKISKIFKEQLRGVEGVTLLNDFDIAPLRFPLLVENRDKVMSQMKDRNILLGDWYSKPVSPSEVDYKVSKYDEGSCPNAEFIARNIINLPTHVNISEEDAVYISQNLIQVMNDLSN